jgi:hypothetical protein
MISIIKGGIFFMAYSSIVVRSLGSASGGAWRFQGC